MNLNKKKESSKFSAVVFIRLFVVFKRHYYNSISSYNLCAIISWQKCWL